MAGLLVCTLRGQRPALLLETSYACRALEGCRLEDDALRPDLDLYSLVAGAVPMPVVALLDPDTTMAGRRWAFRHHLALVDDTSSGGQGQPEDGGNEMGFAHGFLSPE